MSGYNGIPYEEPEGTVWVEVLSAYRDEYYHPDRRDKYVVFEPRVRLTTYPGLDYRNREFVTLKGHRYSLDEVYVNHRSHGMTVDGRSYSKGPRQESGLEVSLKSPARARLRELERRIVARFTIDHPGWQAESCRLYWVDQVAQAEGKAGELRGELAGVQVRVEALRGELAAATVAAYEPA